MSENETLREALRAALDAGPDTWMPYDSLDCGEVFLAVSVRDFIVELRALLDQATGEPQPRGVPAHHLPQTRTAANYGVTCPTCDDGGCPDCTDLTL